MPGKRGKSGKRSSKRKAPNPASPGSLISPVLVTNMVYSQYWGVVESASGVGAYHTFRISDLYDPDFTSTGQQPVAFDQLAALYQRFRVLSVAVEVQYATRAATAARVGVFPSSQSSLPANAESWVCQPFAKHSMVAASGGAPTITRLTARYSLPRILGLTNKEYLTDLDFSGTPSSSPIRNVFAHIWCHNKSGTPSAVEGFITLSYRVEWSQPYLNSVS